MTTQLLHHVEFGAGTPVVMVHGYTVDHRLLLPLESSFAERDGWHRLYVDLPGHGRSHRISGRVTADAMASELLAFIDKTLGSEPFAIVGMSFGGQLARQVVADRGEQVLGMCLFAPVVKPSGRRDLPERRVLNRDETLLCALTPEDREVFSGIAVHQNEEGWAAFRDHVLPGIRLHHRGDAAELLEAYMLSETPESRFSTHEGRHLLVTGRQDHWVGWRDQLSLLDSYPRMTCVAVDGAGHNVHLDRPRLVGGLFDRWLDALETRP
ncbi:alpha/beta fold hydrolase [Streptomyces sp. NPDC002004]